MSKVRSYLKELFKYAPDTCEKVGITESAPCLGKGVHGAVFAGKGKRAVKLTHSVMEAKVARALIGRRLTNVVRIYSVHRVGKKRQWLICMERLHKHRMGVRARSHSDVYAGYRSLARVGYNHRDGHEDNVMLCPRTKRLKIIDFGASEQLG
jgi:serine/threonine protein kinase